MPKPLPPGASHAEDATPTCEILVRRIGLGDCEALRLLHQRHAARLLTLATQLLGDREDAREVVQDVLLEVWRSATRFDAERGQVSAWLAMLLRSRGIDRLRSTRAQRRALLELECGADQGQASTPNVDARIDAAQLRGLVGSLPEQHRRVLELSYVGGLSHSEIAARVGWPLGTVKTRLRASTQTLAALLR